MERIVEDGRTEYILQMAQCIYILVTLMALGCSIGGWKVLGVKWGEGSEMSRTCAIRAAMAAGDNTLDSGCIL